MKFLLLFLSLLLTINPLYAYSTDKDVKEFVQNWFSGFDHNAEEGEFLKKLSSKNLKMVFPEITINSHQDFRKWYQNIRLTIASASHQVNSVTVLSQEKGKIYLDIRVLWQAETYEGKRLKFKAKQLWTLEEEEGELKIKSYIVSEDLEQKTNSSQGGSCVCYGGPGNYQYNCAPVTTTCYGGPGNYPYQCTVCR